MADKYNFGTIEEVPVRSVWKGEASDFTPWLASDDGLKRLGNLIGRNLSLINTEVYVGRYRADIVAKDDNDEIYIIENKFESMDHDHLGKSLVYAAGLKAKHIIIVVEDATPEHSAAIEMLNNISNGGIDFTFMEIHARKIGNSPIVPFFEIIEQPNEWNNIVEKCVNNSNADNIYSKFFNAFQDFAKNNKDVVAFIGNKPLVRPNLGKSYMDLISKNGVSFAISAVLNKNEIKSGIYVRRDHDSLTKVSALIDDIKEEFGDEFNESDSKNLTMNAVTEFNINDQNKWPTAFKWYCESILRWKTVLEPVLKQ